MGLPNASVSQCRRVEVFSWRRGHEPLYSYIDVDEISQGEMVEVPEPAEAPIPRPVSAYFTTSPSGTLIVWKKCDRLDHDARADSLTRVMLSSLVECSGTFSYATSP